MDWSKHAAGRVSAPRWIGRVGLVVAAVAASAIGGMSVASAATYSVLSTVTAGTDPYAAAVDPTTNTVYVTNPSGNNVTVIDGATNTVITTVPVGANPEEVAVDPSSQIVYVSNANDNTVSVIDEATNTVTATVPVGDSPFGIAVNPTTNTVYVANANDATVSVIDGATNTVKATVSVGVSPGGIAVNSTTNTLYAANTSDGTVSVIDGTTNAVTTTISVPGAPAAVAVNPATNTVYVNNYAGAGTVVVINGATNTVTTAIPANGSVWGLAVDSATNAIFAPDVFDDTVSVFDGGTNALVTTLSVGDSPSGLAINPTTHTVYVANNADGTVSVIRQALPPVVTTAPAKPAIVVARVGGADRYATAIAVSQATFPAASAGAVVLASGTNYPDALVGVPLARAKNAPLLLTTGAALPDDTLGELTRVLPVGGTVYLLGDLTAIPASVTTQLTSLGYHVTRIGGADRYRTAVAVANALGDPTTVLLASGASFPDTLVAGPAAAHVGGAVLLTNDNAMTAATSDYLSAHPGNVFAIGGPAAAASRDATKIVGANRYDTAAAAARTFFTGPTTVAVASGLNFTNVLSGGASLAKVNGPLLLTDPAQLPAPTSTYLASTKASLMTVNVIGGASALPDSILTAIRNVLGQ